MFKTLNTAASGMKAQQTNMDVISNNIANVNTIGFKKSRAEFEDLLYQAGKGFGEPTGAATVNAPSGVQVGLGVKTVSVQKNLEVGSPQVTKAPLDLMIQGAGFFQLQKQDGQLAYTRNGSFRRNAIGQIVDANGSKLFPQVVVPANASGLEISPRGEVKIQIGANPNWVPIGQIELAYFVNPSGLKSVGRNLLTATEASGAPQIGVSGEGSLGLLAQGQLESSNVNIADEMVNMITAQRAYEMNSKAIQAADQMLQTTNNLR